MKDLEMLERELPRARLERLIAIDFRMFFLGELGRADLTEQFGITGISVSRDIAYYRNDLGGQIELDASEKKYRLGPSFQPVFPHDVERALRLLSKGSGEWSLGAGPSLVRSYVPPVLSLPKVDTLAAVSRAIHLRRPLGIRYHSFSSGAQDREIVPFALIDNGLRWHTRAFDRRRSEFVDFVLTRIESYTDMPEAAAKPHEQFEHDMQWTRMVELELVPHPKEQHQDIIAMDYAMESGVRRVLVRAALASYLLRNWIVDCSPDHSLQSTEYRLWLRNTPVLYGVSSAHLAPGYSEQNR